MSFSISIEGVDNVMKLLNEAPDIIREQIDDEVQGTLYEIFTKAKQRVPTKNGALVKSASVKHVPGSMSGEVVFQNFYAPYVNFGTGQNAANYLGSVDKEWAAYARQFFVNGKGHIRATPFFTSAVDEERPKLIKRVTEILTGR